MAAVGLDLDAFADLWPAVIESIQAERPLLARAPEGRPPVGARRRRADARVGRDAPGCLKRKAEDAANRELIGRGDARRHRRGAGGSPYELRDADDARGRARRRSREDELVERFVEEFDAEEILPDETREETS